MRGVELSSKKRLQTFTLDKRGGGDTGVDSCLAKRRPFCGFEKLKPVGFCVVCAFRGNYIQRSYRRLVMMLQKVGNDVTEAW